MRRKDGCSCHCSSCENGQHVLCQQRHEAERRGSSMASLPCEIRESA